MTSGAPHGGYGTCRCSPEMCIRDSPVGIAQQESAVTEEKQQTEDRQQRPVTEDSDATIEITRKKKSSDGEKKKSRPPLSLIHIYGPGFFLLKSHRSTSVP